MDVRVVQRWVEAVAGVDAASSTADDVCAAVGVLARLRGWVDSQEVRLAGLLCSVSPVPEADLAVAGRSSSRHAELVAGRVRVTAAVPELGEALGEGLVSGEHVDVVGRELRRVAEADRPVVLAGVVDVAVASSPEELARELRRRARDAARDAGVDRLDWQRSQVGLTSWVDRGSGLTIWRLVTDPVTTVRLSQAIHGQVEALFHDAVPDSCPQDPLAKQEFLRAHALFSLLEGNGGRPGRPEVVVVVDTREPDPVTGGPVVDWGLPVEVPDRVLVELAGRADVHTVVVRNGVVLHAPGVLDLGRSTRLANRAQRRALRGLYRGCAIPGCTARFDNCTIHHVLWWRRGGRTDLANLLPLCSRHHHCVHDGGWVLQLLPDRTLTVTLPGGRVMSTGPPSPRAA
jgi:hypothetical protein